MIPPQLQAYRLPIYRTSPELRVRTLAGAVRFINRAGLAWLFGSSKGPELPSLFDAVKGRRGLSIEQWDDDAGRVWVWKNDLPAARRAYYGKVLMGKPALISLALLPTLYALRAEPFEQLYARGALSNEAKRIYTVLLQGGPQPAGALRRAAGLDSHSGHGRYNRALEELQRALLVLPIGTMNENGAWPSQLFELFDRWFPDTVAAAARLDLAAARRALVEKYLTTVIGAPPLHIARLFALSREDLTATLDELVAARRIVWQDGWVVLRRARRQAAA